MTIVLVSGSYPPRICGVGDYTARLAKELSLIQPGRVVVITNAQNNAEPEDTGGVEVRRVMANWTLAELPKLISALRDEKPSIVHYQYPTNGYGKGLTPWIAPVITRLLGMRVTQTWHEGYNLRQTPTLLLKAAAPGRIIVVRPNYTEFIKPWLKWLLWWKSFSYIRSASTIKKASLSAEELHERRAQYPMDKKLLIFFGFIHGDKGVHRIFDFADPDKHFLVIAGPMSESDSYCDTIRARSDSQQWQDSVQITGALPSDQIAALLSIADAVVLPFEKGGGSWNTSIEAARLNNSFILTTSTSKRGYTPEEDTYYAEPGNVAEMREALSESLAGKFCPSATVKDQNPWQRIAREHLDIYNSILPGGMTIPAAANAEHD